jgi:hypothetical protein
MAKELAQTIADQMRRVFDRTNRLQVFERTTLSASAWFFNNEFAERFRVAFLLCKDLGFNKK